MYTKITDVWKSDVDMGKSTEKAEVTLIKFTTVKKNIDALFFIYKIPLYLFISETIAFAHFRDTLFSQPKKQYKYM